ncbi:MAG: PIN domain-containing protein, partial [bacterium]
MRADLFLDTNILLYAASRSEAEKQKRDIARQLLLSADVGISSQVLAEFYVNATSKLKLPEKEVIGILEAMSDYPTLPVDAELFWAALEIRKRYGISY